MSKAAVIEEAQAASAFCRESLSLDKIQPQLQKLAFTFLPQSLLQSESLKAGVKKLHLQCYTEIFMLNFSSKINKSF